MINKFQEKGKILFKKNKNLLGFVFLSYLDKAIVFLVPLMVLYFFNDKSEYVFIEYIYSIVLILVPLLDFGLGGYFYYDYRNQNNKRKSILSNITTFFVLYNLLFVIGFFLIIIHYCIYAFEEYIIYIVFRVLFLIAITFLASYYRLIDNAKKALYVTMAANLISLSAMIIYFIASFNFDLWTVFIGQIIFCFYFFYKALKFLKRKLKLEYYVGFCHSLKASILFSWPSIIQVFLMMYIANYGKIRGIDNLLVEENTLLSLTQRYATLIQLTHTSILAFLMKELYLSKKREINTKILIKYLSMLVVSVIMVIVILYIHWFFNSTEIVFSRIFWVTSYLIGYTLFWCIYSYFELFFSIENKNIIRLYLAILNGIVFIGVFNFLTTPFLEKVTLGMLISISVSLVTTCLILKRRKYHFA